MVGAVNGKETQSTHKNNLTVDDKLQSIFEQGYKQIMSSNQTPECKKTAMNKLSELRAESDDMVCDTTVEKLEDILEIGDQALESFNSLIADMNTIVNGIPLCFSGKSFWNIISITTCIGGELRSMWTAITDFWDYSDYYMKTVNLIKAYINCINGQKQVSESVLRVVRDMNGCR